MPLHPKTGRPQERNRSCHICTQGVASWRGAFAAPIGCSSCARIFCERCLGNVRDEAVLPLAGGTVHSFFETHWDSWACLMCQGTCACQVDGCSGECAEGARGGAGGCKVDVLAVVAEEGALVVSTAAAHPFRNGDSCVLSAVRIATDENEGTTAEATAEAKAESAKTSRQILALVNKQQSHLKVISDRRFSVPLKPGSAEGLLPLPPLCGGRASLPAIELHKRKGWVGVSGSGAKGKGAVGGGGPGGGGSASPSVKSSKSPKRAGKKRGGAGGSGRMPKAARLAAVEAAAGGASKRSVLGQANLPNAGFRAIKATPPSATRGEESDGKVKGATTGRRTMRAR